MGEAKRRQQLDANYGKIPSLNSANQQQRHVDLIIEQLSQNFAPQIKHIAAAESMIDAYDAHKQLISDWLNKKLELYHQSDRLFLASSIMTVYAEIAMEYEASPLLIKFWYEILESYLSSEKRARIKMIIKKIDAEFI